MHTVTLSSKGQLVIPKSVRTSAQLATGQSLELRIVDGEIRLRPLVPTAATNLNAVAGCLAKPGRRKLSDAQLKQAIQARLKSKG